MAYILDTSEITSEINRIVDDSEAFIFIVTASLNINSRLRRLLKLADEKGVRIFVIYGKWEVKNDTLEWLKSLNNCSIGFIKDLHAKVIVNEYAAVLSSMNLYTFSQENNEELGSLFVNGEDTHCYDRIIDMLDKYSKMCDRQFGKWELDIMYGKVESKPSLLSSLKKGFKSTHKQSQAVDTTSAVSTKVTDPVVEIPSEFYCIRCGEKISDGPYCSKCFKTWSRYSNPEYVEKKGVCLVCGSANPSSMNQPLCSFCYNLYGGALADIMRKQRP